MYPVSTGAEIREAVAKALTRPPSSYERRMESLRLDGLIPTAAPGGGKGSVDFQSHHITYVWESLAAPRPGEAAKFVRQLDALPLRGSNPPGHKPPGQHLGSALVEYLERLAKPFSRGEFLEPPSLAMVKSWQLSICLDPLSAQISMDDSEGIITYYFATGSKPRAPMSHTVMFSGDLWLTFSTLLADTYINENAVRMFQLLDATKPAKAGQDQDAAPSFSDPSRANAAPESNNAGNPRQGVPASMSDQPTPMGPAASPPRKVSAKTKIFKDAPLAGLVTADE